MKMKKPMTYHQEMKEYRSIITLKPLPLIVLLFLCLSTISLYAYGSPENLTIPHTIKMDPRKPTSLDSIVVPRLIHMTLRDTIAINPRVQSVIDSWKINNPSWTVLLYNDSQIESLISSTYPEFLPLYQNLFSPVEKTDLWRYQVIHAYGGLFCKLTM
jgi:hypothetical protein